MRRKARVVSRKKEVILKVFEGDSFLGYDAAGLLTEWPGLAATYSHVIAEGKVRKYQRAHPERTFITEEVS